MIPRVILVDTAAKVAFIGHPNKIADLASAVTSLMKGEVLSIPEEALNEDDFSKDVSVVPGMTGTYTADVPLDKIKTEMAAFTKAITDFSQEHKSTIRMLESDHIITHRQTKLVDGKQLLTRYQQITMLAGSEPVLQTVQQLLNELHNGFQGSFVKEIETTAL
jgi:hypothetical protein